MDVPNRTLLVATNNAGKVADIQNLFAEIGWTLTSGADHALPSPEETEDTLVGNARIKARAAVAATGLTVMTDDSGLFVDVLGGDPGVHAADWADTPNGRDYAVARERLWAEITAAADPCEVVDAQFQTVWLILSPSGEEHVFTGEVRGTLVWPPRGDKGHDYDTMFVPHGSDKTFGEMSQEEKNTFNSRRFAFAAFCAFINTGPELATP